MFNFRQKSASEKRGVAAGRKNRGAIILACALVALMTGMAMMEPAVSASRITELGQSPIREEQTTEDVSNADDGLAPTEDDLILVGTEVESEAAGFDVDGTMEVVEDESSEQEPSEASANAESADAEDAAAEVGEEPAEANETESEDAAQDTETDVVDETEDDSNFEVLEEQKIIATIYKDDTYSEKDDEDETEISIEGKLPVDPETGDVIVEAKAYPVDVAEIDVQEGQEAVLAYDITIYYKDEVAASEGATFQPAENESLKVSFESPVLAELKEVEENTLSVYYIPDEENEEAELVATEEAVKDSEELTFEVEDEKGVLTFEADHFSTYAVFLETLAEKFDINGRASITNMSFTSPDSNGAFSPDKNHTLEFSVNVNSTAGNYGYDEIYSGDFFAIKLPKQLDFTGVDAESTIKFSNSSATATSKIYFEADGTPVLHVTFGGIGGSGAKMNVTLNFSYTVPFNKNEIKYNDSSFSNATVANTLTLSTYDGGSSKSLTINILPGQNGNGGSGDGGNTVIIGDGEKYFIPNAQIMYQTSPVRVGSRDQDGTTLYVLVKEGTTGYQNHANTSFWNGYKNKEWTVGNSASAGGSLPYDVGYCFEFGVDYSTTADDLSVGMVKVPLSENSNLLPADKKAYEAIILNSYPFISAAEMRTRLANAGVSGANSLTISELMAGTQLALWRVSKGSGFGGVRTNIEQPYQQSFYVTQLYPISESQHTNPYRNYTAQANVENIANALAGFEATGVAGDGSQAKLYGYTYKLTDNSNGTKKMTAYVTLTRDLKASETAVLTITDSKGNTNKKTLSGGTSKDAIEIVLDNVAATEATFNLKLEVKDAAGGLVVYTYVKAGAQDMIGAGPGSSEYSSTCKIVIKEKNETTKLKVRKRWVGDTEKTRPTSVVVDLYANGVKLEGQSKTLTSPTWEAIWDNLPKYDANGDEITYTAIEANVPAGYVASYEDSVETITETVPGSGQTTETYTYEEYTWTPIDALNLYHQAFRIRSGDTTIYSDGTSVKTINVNADDADDHAYDMLWVANYQGSYSATQKTYSFIRYNNYNQYLTMGSSGVALTNSAAYWTYRSTDQILAYGSNFLTSTFGKGTSYSKGAFTFEKLDVCEKTETRVVGDGEEETVTTTIPVTTITNRISDEPDVEYEIIKVDSVTGAPLAGATFELVDLSTGGKTVIITGADGKVSMKLELGKTYKLYEIAAPDGYEIVEALDQNHGLTITVSADGKITTTGTSSDDWEFTTENSQILLDGSALQAWGGKLTNIGGYAVEGGAVQYAQNRSANKIVSVYCLNSEYSVGTASNKTTYGNYEALNVGDASLANYTGNPLNNVPKSTITNKKQFAQDIYDVLYAGYPNDGLGLRAKIKEAYPGMSDANIDLMFAVATQQVMWHIYGDIPDSVFASRLNGNSYKAISILWNAIRGIDIKYDYAYKIVVLKSAGSASWSYSTNQNLIYLDKVVGKLTVKNHTKPETPEVEYEIIKVDSETGEPLVGATFELVNQRTGEVTTIVTGADGKVSMKLIPGETYKLYEVAAPEGYEIIESLAKPNGLTITVSATGEISTSGMGADEDWEFTTETSKIPLAGNGALAYGNYFDKIGKETLNTAVQYVKDVNKTISLPAYCLNKGYGMRYETDPVKFDSYNVLTLGDSSIADYTGVPNTKTKSSSITNTKTYAQNLYDILYAGYPNDGIGIRTQIKAAYPELSEKQIDNLFHAATQNAIWYLNGDITSSTFNSYISNCKAASIFWTAIYKIDISYVYSYKIVVLESPGKINTSEGNAVAQNVIYLDKTKGKLTVNNHKKEEPKEVDLTVIKLWEEDDPGYFEVTHTPMSGNRVQVKAQLKHYFEGEVKVILFDLGIHGKTVEKKFEATLSQENNWTAGWILDNTGWEIVDNFIGHRYYVVLEHQDIEVQLIRKVPGTQDQYEYLDKITIGADTDWVGRFTNLPEKDENGNVYEYSVIETSGGDGYKVIVSGTTNGVVYVKNYQGEKIELPVTGGIGLTPFFTFGLLTMIITSILLYRNRIINSERGED